MKHVYYVVAVGLLLGIETHAWSADEPRTNDLDQVITAAATYESGHSLEPFRRLEEAVRQSCSEPSARRGIVTALIQLLGTNSTFEARKFACKQLGIIGSPTALPALETLLTDPETTGIACLALTTYPSGKADDILRATLRASTGTARVQLINTLGDRRDPRAVSLLARESSSSDPAIADAATAALGKIGTPAAWRVIRSLEAKADGEITGPLTDALLRCAASLRATGDAKAAVEIYEVLLARADNIAARRSALSMLLSLDNDEGRRRILGVLEGKDDALKPVAIAGIAAVHSPGASEEFAIQMHHLKPELQALMVERLAALGDDSARLELAKSLSLPDSVVRRAAIAALGKMGDPYFVGLLAQAAASSADPEEARAVEAALVNMKGGAETDRRLVAQLKLSAPKARVPLMAAIARRQGAAASEVLLEETGNSDPAVAKAAFRALAKVGTGKDAAPVLSKIVDLRDAGVRSDAENAAAQLLAKMDSPPRRTTAVREALARATSLDNRSTLIALLSACGDAAALAELKSLTADPEPQVREAAVRALADWPDESAWEPLLAIYRQAAQDNNGRGVALRGLVRLLGEQNARPDADLVARYKQVLSSARSDGELKLLLGVLAGAAHPDAIPLVLPLLSNPGVHAEAVLAANQIIDAIKAQHPQVAEEALKKLQAQP